MTTHVAPPMPPQKTSSGKVVLIVVGVCSLVAVLLITVLLAAILLPALGRARQAATRLKSEAQLRNIAQALTLYAVNNDDRFPGPDEDWQQLILDAGHVTPELLIAPMAQPGQISYFYVPCGEVGFDSEQVLVYENPAIHQHRGGCVAFEDGHTLWLDRDAFFAVIDNITLEDGTPFRPHREQP